MKAIFPILLILCFSLVLNRYDEDEGCIPKLGPNPEITQKLCNNMALHKDLGTYGFTRCCFGRWKVKDVEWKTCFPVTDYQFEHLKDVLDILPFALGTENYNIECSSTFFKFSLLSLIILFL